MIEAVVEDAAVKEDVFRARRRACCRDGAILASNTSSIPIGSLAAATGRPERVIGMHFFNPVPVLKLVEVIRAETTSRRDGRRDRRARARPRQGAGRGARRRRLRLEPDPDAVHQRGRRTRSPRASPRPRRSTPSRGSASATRSGPLALADLIGLDTCVAIMEVLERGLGDPKYAPLPAAPRSTSRPAGSAASRAAASTRTSRRARGPAPEEQCGARGGEHAVVERVGRAEVDGSVHLDHRPAAAGRGQEVDADEIAPDRRGGGERQPACLPRRARPDAQRAERDVRPPLARRRPAHDGSRHAPAGDDDPQVVPGRRHQLLEHAAGRVEPDAQARPGERPGEVGGRVAAGHVAAPASVPRLQHHRKRELRRLEPRGDVRRYRVRQPRLREDGGRRELVVRSGERAPPVQDRHPALLQQVERPEAGLDPVERPQDVQPAECDVARPQPGHRLRRCEPRAETGVRRRVCVRDHRKHAHGTHDRDRP